MEYYSATKMNEFLPFSTTWENLDGIFNNFICLFIFGCAGPLLLHGLSLVVESGDYSLAVLCRLVTGVASHCRAWALGRVRFRTCGVWVQQLLFLDSRAHPQ